MTETVTSKLGKTYNKAEMDARDEELHRRLNAIKSRGGNSRCAECGASPTSWASVSLGVFVCTNCAQIHRGLGAHVSKIKSCMGTYQWFPDELEAMDGMGNDKAALKYGVPPAPAKPVDYAMYGPLFNTTKDRYEKLAFAGKSAATTPKIPVVTKPAAPKKKDDEWEDDW
eukprot:TRINITY_DN7641_c0_g1_i1.p1 TRINITY_DN7641_c0_g1~~TRINITY_DN7641_c0_g1_i1.p1  ORF type:complete len:170 (+),score=27.36 TRINITY_DN7641_c0_g1_i1:82-591(+)